MAAEKKAMNIYQKLAALREKVEVIQRNKSGYNYTYVSEDEIMARISVGMKQQGLSLIPNIVPGTTQVSQLRYEKTKFTKTGTPYEEHITEHVVSADMTYTWVNNENPEEQVVVPWAMIGQQADASQAFGSGLSYTARYFLLKYFNVATPEDDPDEFRRKQKASEEEETARITKEMVETLDAMVKKALQDKVCTPAQVKAFMEKNGVTGGNYFKIKEQKQLADLLESFPKLAAGTEGK